MRRNNLNHRAGWALVPMFVFLVAATSFGAVLLEDNFTDAAVSHGKWLNSLDNDMMSVAVSGGSCNINNTSAYGGEYYHTFGTKPSTFTISFVLKSVSQGGNAGVLFCRSSGFNGYYLTLFEDTVALFKYANGGGNTIYFKKSVDINPSADNKLTVSKQGSEIHLFANDLFQGKVTDAQYSSGDVSLFVPQHTSAVFGAFNMVDTFTEGGPRTSFADNFDNGRSKYWKYLNAGGAPEINDASGTLTVKTEAGVNSWMYVDLAAADFTARVDVRHVAGGTSIHDKYGIVLLGDAPPGGGTIPMVHFAITGNRWYSVWGPNDDPLPDPAQNTAIRGSAGILGVVLIDTLEVSRKSASSAYEFTVNGVVLANYPVANFPITGIGIFTYPGTTIAFDNFEAKKEGTTSIKFGKNPPQSVRGKTAAKNANAVFYDLRGRKRYVANPQAAGRTLRAAGVYVSQNGREVRTDKNRRTR